MTCHTSQLTKKGSKKYGRLPEKVAETDPWNVLCIDLIGPYKIERKNKTKKPLILRALTMIDPATGWFEMKEIKTKAADSVAYSTSLEQTWLTRYPWPTQMIFHRGSKFKAELSQTIKKYYGIKSTKSTSKRYSGTNTSINRKHDKNFRIV
jgi:hypothetical protein